VATLKFTFNHVPSWDTTQEINMKEYFFKIHIEGMNGYLYYSVEAESEQEAVDMVDYYMQSAPHIIEKDNNYVQGKELV
tara:strand:- start:251 stop:487 length:237 start_codon:yes stop_codon:yes gene_type:complete